MAKGVLALTVDGKLTYCIASEDMRGKGRCNHVDHQRADEDPDQFMERINEKMMNIQNDNILDENDYHEITQEEIDGYASRLDEIAGCKVTEENFYEVVSKLPPEKIAQIANIGFEAAPHFSLPIQDENYREAESDNRLYFATLPEYGIGGNKPSVKQMFEKVGTVPTLDGDYEIEHSFQEGLTAHEYFMKQFEARDNLINKSVSTAKPGYTARKLFYSLSDIQIADDCGGEHIDILHCSMPEGHICEKCAAKTKGGEKIYDSDGRVNRFIGGRVSTDLSEGLTQLSMKHTHISSAESREQQNDSATIMSTLDGWSTSPIIDKMVTEGKTTEERRQIMYDGLKEAYHAAGIAVDDFDLQVAVKKLTSYKRTNEGLVPIKEGELCDVASMMVTGNKNNIFKTAELSTGYKALTRPNKQEIGPDAANQILR